MPRYIVALISLTILLALVRAESSSLNCGNLDAATCKQYFRDQLDEKIKDVHVKSYERGIKLSKAFYEKVLKDLPENSEFSEPIKKHLSTIDSIIPKLNKDITGERFIEIIKETTYDPKINFSDNELAKRYDDILLDHDIEKFRADTSIIKTEMHDKQLEAWKDLFVHLRPVDIAAYSEYEKLYEDLRNSRSYNSAVAWKEIGIFFDAPYLKTVYRF